MSKMEQTRRDFLKLAGKTVLGAAALTAVPAVVKADATTEIAAPAFPWTWPGLDVKEVQDKIYANFFAKGGCCAGVASGILDLLAEKYGYPYNQIDGRMFAHGGGGYGRRNLCGSLGGAFAVLNLFTTGGDMSGIRTKIYEWYETSAFPIYQPADKPEHPVHSVAGTELCKDSVGNWMAASGHEFGDPERGVRCASLSADVGGKLVELLNAHFAGKAAEAAPAEPELPKNTFVGVGEGFEGKIEATVTFDDNGKITNITTKHNETAGFSDSTFNKLVPAIIAAGTVEEGIDVTSGATSKKSNAGLLEAVNDAIRQYEASKK